MSFSQMAAAAKEAPEKEPVVENLDQGDDSFSAEDIADLTGGSGDEAEVVSSDDAGGEPAEEAADDAAAGEAEVVSTEQPAQAGGDDIAWPEIGDDLAAVDLSALPEKAQAWAGSLVSKYKEHLAAAESAMADFEEAKALFQKLAAEIDDGGKSASLAEEVEVYRGGYNSVASENVALANDLFKLQNPDYAKAPPDLVQKFHDAVSNESFYQRWTEGTLAKKMSDAWAFEKSRAGWSAPTKEAAGREALVETGDRAGGKTEARIEDLSYRDILDRHDHLLA
jgi:hypothetical protein